MNEQLPPQTALNAADIIRGFESQQGWEAKYRQIMQLAKQLTPLPPQYRQAQYLVQGCESQVWLYCKKEQQRYWFYADSDARIIRGLLVIILAAYNGLSESEIKQVDIKRYFAQLDLLKHLSPSRNNGIYGIIETIERFCDIGRAD